MSHVTPVRLLGIGLALNRVVRIIEVMKSDPWGLECSSMVTCRVMLVDVTGEEVVWSVHEVPWVAPTNHLSRSATEQKLDISSGCGRAGFVGMCTWGHHGQSCHRSKRHQHQQLACPLGEITGGLLRTVPGAQRRSEV